MDEDTEKTQWVQWTVAIIGVAIIIVGGWWMLTHRGAKAGASAENKGEMATTTDSADASGGAKAEAKNETAIKNDVMETGTIGEAASPASDGSIAVENQKAGDAVVVKSAALSKPGWIAIRDSKKWYLGAAWFPGSVTSATVPLLRATAAGEKYEVLVFADDGDKKFDFHKDTLVEGETATFTAN